MHTKKIFLRAKNKIFFLRKRKIFFLDEKQIFFLRKQWFCSCTRGRSISWPRGKSSSCAIDFVRARADSGVGKPRLVAAALACLAQSPSCPFGRAAQLPSWPPPSCRPVAFDLAICRFQALDPNGSPDMLVPGPTVCVKYWELFMLLEIRPNRPPGHPLRIGKIGFMGWRTFFLH